MKWHKINYEEWPDGRNKSFSDLSSGEIVDGTGRCLTDFIPGQFLSMFDIGSGIDVREVKQIYLRIDKSLKKGLGDCLGYTVRTNLLFSTRFMEAMRSISPGIDESSLLIPIKVVNGRNESVWNEDYTLVWPGNEWTVLDREKAKYEVYPKTEVISEVYQWAMKPSDVPKYDMFKAKDRTTWIVSEPARKAILEAGCEGVNFKYLCST